MNSGDSVATVLGSIAENGKSIGLLEPSLLEVLIEDALSISISDTRAKNVNLKLGLSFDR